MDGYASAGSPILFDGTKVTIKCTTPKYIIADLDVMKDAPFDMPYIATNPDLCCPTEYGSVSDCGSVCQMIYNATGKKPFVVRKPAKLMIELCLKKENCAKERAAAIGDRIYADIKCGLNAGVRSVLVLSGETTPEILQSSDVRPDVVLQNAGEIRLF